MLGAKPSLNNNHNNDYANQKRKSIKIFNRIPHNLQTNQTFDIRLILFRHAERIDQSLGRDWYKQVFGDVSRASTNAYQHPALPYRLPHRSNTLLYEFDPPITRSGEKCSFSKGQQLHQAGITVDYCYSSPASRSILTANAILNGMNRHHVPMRLEPYLFEPMTWNSHLSLLGKISPFMSTGEWKNIGYNVDQKYKRLNNYLNPRETETDYYHRSQDFFDAIERRHGVILSPHYRGLIPRSRTTIMVVGHAPSTQILSTIALREAFDANSFVEQSGKVPYLHTVVLERDAMTRIWYIRPIMYCV